VDVAAERNCGRGLPHGIDMDLDNGSRFENEAFALTFSTTDKVEGMTAFLEKREAKFTGK
jgi:enoyl-CoA hydratase